MAADDDPKLTLGSGYTDTGTSTQEESPPEDSTSQKEEKAEEQPKEETAPATPASWRSLVAVRASCLCSGGERRHVIRPLRAVPRTAC
jgi:hypothetical protein